MAAQGVVFTRADEEAAWKTLFDFLKADDGRPRWLPGMNLRRAALSYHARAAGPAPEVIAMATLSFRLWRAVARHGRTATRDLFYHWRTVRHPRPQEAAAGGSCCPAAGGSCCPAAGGGCCPDRIRVLEQQNEAPPRRQQERGVGDVRDGFRVGRNYQTCGREFRVHRHHPHEEFCCSYCRTGIGHSERCGQRSRPFGGEN